MSDAKSACSFTEWYPLFAKESLDTIILPLPEEVTKYLEQGAFYLPAEATKNDNRNNEWSDDYDTADDDEEDTEQPTFPDFSAEIERVIREFRAVFLKLNWSAPFDAAWIAPTKTLRCTTLEDVYLLLKSSDRVTSDLSAIRRSKGGNKVVQPSLILKRWREINPCTEFRCFVLQNQLVGISQRDLTQYYRYIELEKYDIRRDIISLFNERIKTRFPLENYTFDVIRYKKDQAQLLDFHPFDSTSKTLLFSHEELQEDRDDRPEFRFIGENVAIQPHDAGHFCIPREIGEYFQSNEHSSVMDLLQHECENQENENV